MLMFGLIFVVSIMFVLREVTKTLHTRDTTVPQIESYIHYPSAKPNVETALQHLAIQFHNKADENALLALIKLYLFGMNPEYRPNKLTGLKIIQFVHDNKNRFSMTLLKNCEVYREQIHAQAYSDPDVFGSKDLPDDILSTLSVALKHHYDNKVEPINCTYLEIDEPDEVEFEHTDEEDGRRTSEQQNVRLIIRSDAQNVHNISVPNSIQQALKAIIKLNETQPELSFQHARDKFKQFLEKNSADVDEHVQTDAWTVIESLTSSKHSKFNISEQEVFANVCNRIFNKKDADSLLLILLQNLTSAIEHGEVVCSTGKISRLVSTFDAVDDAVPDLKPDWIIKQELGTLASKIRESILDASDSKTKKEYEQSDDSPLSDEMRLAFLKEAKERYVDTGLLTDAGVELLSSDYIGAF